METLRNKALEASLTEALGKTDTENVGDGLSS
jgi:hypothetical protein